MTENNWPKGTHKVDVDLGRAARGSEHHQWHLAEHGRDGEGYLLLLWVCPCGAYVRRVITVPYLDGTLVPDVHDAEESDG
jgi:hypothetical protein